MKNGAQHRIAQTYGDNSKGGKENKDGDQEMGLKWKIIKQWASVNCVAGER